MPQDMGQRHSIALIKIWNVTRHPGAMGRFQRQFVSQLDKLATVPQHDDGLFRDRVAEHGVGFEQQENRHFRR
jgi:hypothetical protein